MELAKRYLAVICSCMVLMAGGCATIEQRVARRIEYIVPQTKAAPGEVFHLSYVLPSQVKTGRVTFLKKNYRLFPRPDLKAEVYTAFLPVPLGTKPGEYQIKCKFTVAKGKQPIREKIPIQIMPDFRPLREERVHASGFRMKAFQQEQEQIKRRLSPAGYKTKRLQDFRLPLAGRVAAAFGMRRTYNSRSTIALEGIEIVPWETGQGEVRAAADGQVIVARRFPMLGNTVLIEHGFSFATMYCHLKTLKVQAGRKIQRGRRLGLVGSTGQAAVGKRLRYQMYVAGIPIDVQKYTGIKLFH